MSAQAFSSPTPHRAAHVQWKTRPPDERFETLPDLKAAVLGRRQRSSVTRIAARDLAIDADDGRLSIATPSVTLTPTHWAFGQFASDLGAPASYLRTLPPSLAAACLNDGLGSLSPDLTWATLATSSADGLAVRAFCSPTYGRIWDAEIVAMVEALVDATDGRFFNPKDWSGRPSGLYASDRDIFCFLIDGGSVVDGGTARDQLHRGFYVWNSEVGRTTFGLATFLFRKVCGNHLIHGVEDLAVLKIRHSSRAPQRFIAEAVPQLRRYATASPRALEGQLARARAYRLPPASERVAWLQGRGFTIKEAQAGLNAAVAEEGHADTLWDVVNGLTAVARDLGFTDQRVALDRKAGSLLQLAA